MQDTHTVALVHYCDDVASLLVSIEAISPDERCDLLVVSGPDACRPIEPDVVRVAWQARGAAHLITTPDSAEGGEALNEGIRWCADQGYRNVARLVRGDRSVPGRLTAQSTYLDAHPDVAAVGGAVAMVDGRGAITYVVRPPTEHEEIMAAMRLGNPMTDGALMFRTADVLAVRGYPAGYPGAADYALVWRLAERGRLANLAEFVIERPTAHRGVPLAARATELRSRMRVQRDHLDSSWRARYGIVRTTALMAVPQSALVRAKRVLMSEDASARPVPESPETRRSYASQMPDFPTQAARIALVPGTGESAGAADLADIAIAFCQRGESVRLVATADPMTAAEPAGWDAVATLFGRPPSVPGVPTMAITDAAGAPVTQSAAVVEAVNGHDPWIEVQVRDGLGSVLAVGAVSTLRSVAATQEQMLRVAGPMLVVAARALPLPAAVADDFWDTVPAQTSQAARGADATASVRFIGRLAMRGLTTRQWQVARLPVETWRPSARLTAPLRWRTAPNENFWADPHLVVDEGRTWLLVEELDMTVGRGAIRLLEVIGDDVAPHGILLRTQHHLSYPQTYRTAQGWLGTVETCAAHNPVYTFDRLGAPWRPAQGLPPLPPHLADPVLLLQDGHVTGVLGTDARVDPDSVVVRFDFDRSTGRWRRDDASVRVSVINGRGGGTLDVRRGLRATQDCAGVYGRALEIIDYPETDPPEVRWRLDGQEFSPGPDADGRLQGGMHTLTWADGAGPNGDEVIAWCDGWHTRATPRGWLLDLRERQHLDECEG